MNDFFEDYKKRIFELKNLDVNEAITRSNLIDPLLIFLGWNIHDLTEVEQEKQVISRNFVDYALKIDGIAKLYIEAKKINDDLTDMRNVSRAVSYTNDDGIEWCLMTNGDKLNLYQTRKPGNLNDKLVLEIQISTERNLEFLEFFKKKNVENNILETEVKVFIKIIKTLNQIYDIENDNFLDQIQTISPDLTRDQIKKALGHIKHSLIFETKSIIVSEMTYWMTSIKSDNDETETVEEALHSLLVQYNVYAYGDRTPGRKTIKPKDKICFYATGKGVMADAIVASYPERRMHEGIKDIENFPWIFDLKDPNLYFENPTIIDADLRAQLDAFKDKDPHESNWAWFVQSTKKISEHDFKLLTKNT